jgi:hypothetical protein
MLAFDREVGVVSAASICICSGFGIARVDSISFGMGVA